MGNFVISRGYSDSFEKLLLSVRSKFFWGHWKKSVYSTLCKNCGIIVEASDFQSEIVFFHVVIPHSILYSDQRVEILWKFLAYLQSVEKYCGICKLFCKCGKLWKFCRTN